MSKVLGIKTLQSIKLSDYEIYSLEKLASKGKGHCINYIYFSSLVISMKAAPTTPINKA